MRFKVIREKMTREAASRELMKIFYNELGFSFHVYACFSTCMCDSNENVKTWLYNKFSKKLSNKIKYN